MKRILAAVLPALLLVPLHASHAQTGVPSDEQVQQVSYLDVIAARRSVRFANPSCTTPGCTAPGCTTPGCATPACAAPSCAASSRGCDSCGKDWCKTGLLPAMWCKVQQRRTQRCCTTPGCTTCTSRCAVSGCASPGCASACGGSRCGTFGRCRALMARSLGCGGPVMGSCEVPACCGEPPCKNYWGSYCYEQRPSLADAMRGAMACARARRCTGRSLGCTTSCSTASSCCTTPGCVTRGCAAAPHDMLKSPFQDDDDSLMPPTPPAPEAASTYLRRSPATYGPTGRGLLPIPAQSSRPVGRMLPRLQALNRFSAVSRIDFEEDVQSVPLGLQILTMPNGAQMVQNPYVTAPVEETAEEAAPRLLSIDQQDGTALVSASETVAPQESNEEVRALPAMIRFIRTSN